MSIRQVVTALSLRATEYLVDAGYAHGPSGTITGATNATPIVVTVGTRLGFPVGQQIHAIVSGVGGNANANGTRVAVVVSQSASTTSLALYERADSEPSGLAPVAGSGAYTSGGTLVSAFPDGRVLLGPEHVADQTAPPRIVVVPRLSALRQANPVTSRPIDLPKIMAAPPRYVDAITFDVHLWAARYVSGALASDPDWDWDALEALRGAWVYSLYDLCLASVRYPGGTWSEAEDGSAKLDISGRRLLLQCTIDIPARPTPASVLVLPAGWGEIDASVVFAPSDPDGPQAIEVVIP